MATGTVYLDVDDEITSAASRIRSSESPKVGLVVPYGSRISTSRMNFRLLSREAVVNNRRLSIIAGDPATRALAASAGLPVFATVGEYESALAGPSPAVDGDDGGPPIAPIEASAPAVAATTPSPEKPSTKRRARRGAASDDTQAIVVPAVAPAAAADSVRGPVSSPPTAMVGPPAAASAPGLLPVRGAIGRFRVGTPVIAGAAVIALAVALLGVGGYLILPAADITVTPRVEAIGPIPLTVTADPDAPSVDAANNVVPAVRLDVPVDVSDTFTTEGKRVELTAATGTVTFSNYDPTAPNTVEAGSFVSTEGGIRFKTVATITLPKAEFHVGLPITPSTESVAVQAVKDGPAGNVPANAIRVVPQGENPEFLKVNNNDPTSGGARNEFAKVSQKDIDRALAALQSKLDEAFTAAVAEGAGAPLGATLFPETAALGDATPTSDPTKLLNQEVETFQLGMSASGTVIAVDASPVKEIARTRLLANVNSGYRLVDGSDQVDQGKPVVSEGVVSFPVSARAAQVRIVDPEALRALVKGQSIDQARALLQPFGDVSIETWPAWVSSITGFDARLTVKVGAEAGDGAGPGASGRPSSNGSARPSTGVPASKSPAAPATSEAPAESAAP